jgi:hypothetical protein
MGSLGETGTAPSHKLRYRLLQANYAICRLGRGAAIPRWATVATEFISITRTPDELSIVCPREIVPGDVQAATGFVCLQLAGPFPMTETGILTSFAGPLSAREIPIFVVATFDTDYVLIPENCWSAAHEILGAAGHEFMSGGD